MKWRKLGFVWRPGGERAWARRYAHVPTPERIGDSLVRVHFAALDERNFGRTASVDLDLRTLRVVGEDSEPRLDLGELGAFDDCGAVPSCIVRTEETLLYYIGFQRAERVPYMLFTGLARRDESTGRWLRVQRTPILDRTPEEPFSRAGACVLAEGAAFRMWYWSCLRWEPGPAAPHYVNALMHARSADGIVWHADASPLLLPDLPDEYALGRPWVLRDADRFRMWFSARSHSKGYAIGYAESSDGLAWTRRDELAGIETSAEGWDSEMICYPAVIDAGGRRFMFYNGNRHGATGFGVAVLEEG